MSRFVHGDGAIPDKALVEQVLADLTSNLEKWEAVLAAQESVTFAADWGDIYAVCNADGRLMELALAPDVMSSYTYGELTDRLNSAFEELRKEAEADFDQNYDGRVID